MYSGTTESTTAVRDEVGETTLELFRDNDGYSEFLWRALSGLGRRPIGPRVLEVGCGIGNLTRTLLAEAGVERVHAIDLDPAYVDRVRREIPDPRLEVSTSRAEEFRPPPLVEPNGSFDTIVCINVLEHIEDHQKVLCNFATMLRPGGQVLLLVPAHPSLFCGLDRGLSHFRRYARRDLLEVAAGARLRVESLRHFNPLGTLGWWLNGRVLRRSILPAGQLSFYTRFAIPLSRFLDRLNPLPIGISLLAALSGEVPEEEVRPAAER